jgi:hypothetical protein
MPLCGVLVLELVHALRDSSAAQTARPIRPFLIVSSFP